jgi:hypothetical protein
MTERSDLSDGSDPQLKSHRPEPPELKEEIIRGRDFAGTAFAANAEEQTADERAGKPESLDIDYRNTPERVRDHGLKE